MSPWDHNKSHQHAAAHGIISGRHEVFTFDETIRDSHTYLAGDKKEISSYCYVEPEGNTVFASCGRMRGLNE